jgi:CRP/FNR family cyclic AMP-dependent transcriptional regulator
MMRNIPVTLPAQDQSFRRARGLVAKVLLDHAIDSTAERGRLAQRDIAVLAGTDWETAHAALKSLQDEGVIRIERHRLIINKKLLQKVAGVA